VGSPTHSRKGIRGLAPLIPYPLALILQSNGEVGSVQVGNSNLTLQPVRFGPIPDQGRHPGVGGWLANIGAGDDQGGVAADLLLVWTHLHHLVPVTLVPPSLRQGIPSGEGGRVHRTALTGCPLYRERLSLCVSHVALLPFLVVVPPVEAGD
jgi:hypothetical protein